MGIIEILKCPKIQLSFIFFIASIIILFDLQSQLQSYLDKKIKNDIPLTSNKYSIWGQYSYQHSKNIENEIILYDIGNQDLNSNIIDYKSSNSIKYLYQLQYQDPVYMPNTNNQISFKTSFNHQLNDTKSVEEKYSQINLGLIQNYEMEKNQPFQKQFVIQFFQYINHIREQFIPNYFSYQIQIFYNQNENLDQNNQMFKLLSNIVGDNNLAIQIFNDKEYGWNNYDTFQNWVKIIINNKYQEDQIYNDIKLKFNLNNETMLQLIGKNSKINQIYLIINALISENYSDCDQQLQQCTIDQLVVIQWLSCGVTQLNLFKNQKIFINGISDLNSTIPKQQEFYFHSQNKQIDTDITKWTKILQYGKDKTILQNDQTIFNFKNMKFIKDNEQQKLQYKIAQNLGLNNQGDTIQTLISYINQFYQNDETRSISFMGSVALSSVSQFVQDYLLLNMTTKGLYKKFISESKTCEQIFNGAFSNSIIYNICDDMTFNLISNIDAGALWSSLFLQQKQSLMDYLTLELKIEQKDIDNFLNQSIYKTYFDEIQKSFKERYNCANSRCQSQELMIQQIWGIPITSNLSTTYFDANYTSLQQWSPDLFINFRPEISSYSQDKKEKQYTVNQDILHDLISYKYGGILNAYQLKQFNQLVQQQNYQQIKEQFKLEQDDVQYISGFIKNLIVQYLFNGIYTKKSYKQLLWGAPDYYKQKLKDISILEGGFPNNTDLVYLKKLNNEKSNQEVDINKLNYLSTGIDDYENVGDWKKLYGNDKIYSLQTYDNGGVNVLDIQQPYNKSFKIKGTDGFGFKPFLKENDELNLFNYEFKRNIKLNQIQKTTCNQQYDCYKYEYSPENYQISQDYNNLYKGGYNLSKIYNYPLYAMQGFFDHSDQQLYSKITIDKDYISKKQKNTDNYYEVEINTGKTVNFYQNLLYFVDLKQNLLLQDDYIKQDLIIPLYSEEIQYKFTDDEALKEFQDYYVILHEKDSVVIIFTILSVIFGFYSIFLVYLKLKDQNKDNVLLEQNSNLIV